MAVEDEKQPLLRSVDESRSSVIVNDEFVTPKQKSNMSNAYFVLITNIVLTFASAGFNSTLTVIFKDYLNFSTSAATTLGNCLTALGSGIGLLGGIVSDSFLGPSKTLMLGLACITTSQIFILLSRVVYMTEGTYSLFRGLTLGAIFLTYFSGFYKPCISTLMGDQFLPEEEKTRSTFVAWYYLSIQVGAVVASIGAPIILETKAHKERPNGFTNDGPFIVTIAIISMFILSMAVLYIPWKKYVKKPPGGNVFIKFLRIIFSGFKGYPQQDIDDAKQVLNVFKIFVTLPFFWAIYQQSQYMWTYQAEAMNLTVKLGSKSFLMPYAAINSMNPFMDLFLIPFFASFLYPFLTRLGLKFNDLHKMGAGQIFSAGALIAQGLVQQMMIKNPLIPGDPNSGVSFWWISIQYFLISCAEILVAVAAYDFAYTQAAPKMRGTVTAVWILVISLGTLLSSVLPWIPMDPSKLCYVLAAVQIVLVGIFGWIASGYKIKSAHVEEIKIPQEESEI